MSFPPTISAAQLDAAFPILLLAQTQQELIDTAQQREMERLLNGGKHIDHSADFTTFVILPFVFCLGLIVILRRMLP